MLTLNLIRENKAEVIQRLQLKNFDAKNLINKILALDEERRSTQNKLDNVQSELNAISREIGALMQFGRKVRRKQRRSHGCLKTTSKHCPHLSVAMSRH
jgi:seryl-tRNA synthetase